MGWDRWFRWDAIDEASRELAESLAVRVLSLDGAGGSLPFATAFSGTQAAAEVLPSRGGDWPFTRREKRPLWVGKFIQRTLLYECRGLFGEAQPHVFKKRAGPALVPSFLLIWPVVSVEQWFLTGPPQDRCSHLRGGSLWSHSRHFQRFCLLEQLAVVFICSESNLELRNPFLYKGSILHSSSVIDSRMHISTSLKLECVLQLGIFKLN